MPRFLTKQKRWMEASIWNYSLFFLGGTFSLAAVRLFQIWATDSWDYINLYYSTVAFSICVSVFAILLRYLATKGYLDRNQKNIEKWLIYENLVCTKYNLDFNFKLNKAFLPILFLSGFSLWLVGNFKNFVSGGFLLLSSLLFLCYFTNYLYITYYMIKTPVPEECLLAPPHLLIKIAGIIPQNNHSRDYSTNSKFQRSQVIFTQNKRYLWPIFKVTGLLISAAVTADLGVAAMGGETAYSTRSLDKNRYGWFTNSPKARERAIFLVNEMGEDPGTFTESDKRLNIQKVYSIYNKYKASNFEKP